MAPEHARNYHFEMSAALLAGGKWAPYLEIRICTEDDEAGEVIFPRQRIAEHEEFASENEAVAEAQRFALSHVSSGEF